MKKTDLVVGETYAVRRTMRTTPSGYSKMMLVAIDVPNTNNMASTAKSGVGFAFPNEKHGWRPHVVQPNLIVALWKDVEAEVNEERSRERAERLAKEAHRESVDDRQDRLRKKGLTVSWDYHHVDRGRVSVPLEQVERLVNLLERSFVALQACDHFMESANVGGPKDLDDLLVELRPFVTGLETP